LIKFTCSLASAPDSTRTVEAHADWIAAQDYAELADQDAGGELSSNYEEFDVLVMAPGGLPKRFTITPEAVIRFYAEEQD